MLAVTLSIFAFVLRGGSAVPTSEVVLSSHDGSMSGGVAIIVGKKMLEATVSPIVHTEIIKGRVNEARIASRKVQS